MPRTVPGAAALVGYAATIPAANLLITYVGTAPVAPGLVAPAGVYAAGAALVLRDLVHEWLGKWAALLAMTVGVVLSYLIAAPALAIASAAAFAVSELADFTVYAPLRRRGMALAVAASGAVGLVVDSVLFLGLAFGSYEFLAGQIIGKAWMTLAAALIIVVIHRLHTARSAT
ncbi:VUT family protein [Streptosporangium roseum]|uniref:VUT family protein n=1 Tax=Streptosporangium roseum TaxID=2001 RepID=UPI00332CE5D4